MFTLLELHEAQASALRVPEIHCTFKSSALKLVECFKVAQIQFKVAMPTSVQEYYSVNNICNCKIRTLSTTALQLYSSIKSIN